MGCGCVCIAAKCREEVCILEDRSRFDGLCGALLDATARVMLVVDPQGGILLANRPARQRLGAVDGQPLEAVVPGFWPQVRRVIEGLCPESEIPISVQGLEFLAGIQPVEVEGVLVGALCVLVESTRLEQMIRRLPSFHALTRELDTIIDSSSDGLFVCDAEANVIRMNPASERIHKRPASEIVGRNMSELIEQGFIDRSAALEASRQGKAVSLLQNKDGRKLISIATPVFDEAGALIRVVVSERDVTEIDALQRSLEEQEAIRDEFRTQMLEMQQAKLESRRIIARSSAMIRAIQQAVKVSRAESSVLILGESGVGKGLIADLIHKNSSRAEHPLIKINCGAIPESLIEAELFGYEKGAFTGAQAKGKPGHFELADGGILFLDEIAELPLASQVKLLRFLEDGRITRLGATTGRRVDVRILAATHRNLEEMVEKGLFRHDLYYRLNVIPLHVPAVRERQDCIVPLLRHYIAHFSAQAGCEKRLTRAALDALAVYPYPGNVRELMNICERLVVMTETELIDLPDLPVQVTARTEALECGEGGWPEGISLQQAVEQVEKGLLEKALRRFGNQMQMAAALGVNQSTIARKLKKHGLE